MTAKKSLLASVSMAAMGMMYATRASAVSCTGVFTYTGTIETCTTYQAGIFGISATGAVGGAGWSGDNGGGLAKGSIFLDVGTTLQILVGGAGKYNYIPRRGVRAAGGGGGSFVAQGASPASSTPLVVGGGGGGSPDGRPGRGYYSYTSSSPAGNGAGGAGVHGGGGAGFFGNGGDGRYFRNDHIGTYLTPVSSIFKGGVGGSAFTAGGAGGAAGSYNGPFTGYDTEAGGRGGFGGGGGGDYVGGGGGGGYTGGRGGRYDHGRGGTSFVTSLATDVSFEHGINNAFQSHGSVAIEFVGPRETVTPVPLPATSALLAGAVAALGGAGALRRRKMKAKA